MKSNPNLKQAAENLLDNPDFPVLLHERLRILQDDILFAIEAADVLKAHAEYNTIKDFADWITELGKD